MQKELLKNLLPEKVMRVSLKPYFGLKYGFKDTLTAFFR
jgi:hypothetical protein